MIHTGRYFHISDPDAVIIRTTTGKTKAPPAKNQQVYVEALSIAPWSSFRKDNWKELYPRELDQRRDIILAEVAAIRAAHPGRALVFCCFDGDPADCHRSLFAEWWTKLTGEEVVELCPHVPKPEPVPDPQMAFVL